MDKQCGIYLIKNLSNGKNYIGQSIDIIRRWSEHKARANNINNNCYNKPLYLAMRKYGIDNFKLFILELCSSEELNQKEAFYINKYNSLVPNGYNILSTSDKNVSVTNKCKKCGKIITKNTVNQLCRKCYIKSTRIVERPDVNELKKLLIENNFVQVGKIFGVTDNTIRKWCRFYGISDKAKDYKCAHSVVET